LAWLLTFYSEFLKETKGANDKTPGNLFKPRPTDNNKEKALYRVGPMRELLIISASTNAALFDLWCRQVGKSTLVDNLQGYRDRDFTGFDMVDFLCNATNVAEPTTALGYLEWMVDGSPTLRAMFRYVQQHHLGDNPDGKLLITEDVPMTALFWDWALNMLLVPTTIFHAGLDSAARKRLTEEFNGEIPTDLRAMGILYGVSAEGVNFQQDCNRVYIPTPALNQGSELQASCRPIRVSSNSSYPIKRPFEEGMPC
jgi:hypothetical protein